MQHTYQVADRIRVHTRVYGNKGHKVYAGIITQVHNNSIDYESNYHDKGCTKVLGSGTLNLASVGAREYGTLRVEVISNPTVE